MGRYFHGFKQKAGLITLAFACSVMLIWARSYKIVDGIGYSIRPHLPMWISSADGRLWLCAEIPVNWETYSPTWKMFDSYEFKPEEAFPEDTVWYANFCGFGYCTNIYQLWSMPYWILVLLPTLLSIWLLTSKSHRLNESVPDSI